MRTMEELINLLNNKDGILFIGPNITKKEKIELNEEELKLFTNRGLIRDTENFYKLFKEKIMVENTEEEKDIYTKIDKLLKTGFFKYVIIQNFDYPNVINFDDYDVEVYELKGNNKILHCKYCNTVYDINSKINDDYIDFECEICGKNLLPQTLLNKQKYNERVNLKIQECLGKGSVLFCVGLDYNEEIVLDYIDLFDTIKKNKKAVSVDRMTVCIIDDEKFDPNEIIYNDFLINGNVKDTIDRLLNNINK